MKAMEQTHSLKKDGSKFWDANPCGGSWSTYQEFMEWYQRTEPSLYKILDNYEWHDKKVLEVGCGQGSTLNYISSFGAFIYGLDMSLQSLRQARVGAAELGSASMVSLLQADAENLPFSSNAYDIVLSIGVLHHTADTAGSISQIYRLLKPGGQAVVMLYRSGNPKWWMTSLLRAFSRLVDFISGKPNVLLESLRARQQRDSSSGTALLELFGVPILKAFSNRESRKMFASFTEVRITNQLPGFLRLVDILPWLKPIRSFLNRVDQFTEHMWGFYQVIEARK
ncbi:MAG: class I SAM-dependent methyltransferase [Chloroflexi bacterium]|nr:class I SAM-dependent methyltransferase [Chloroflexota bacterium]